MKKVVILILMLSIALSACKITGQAIDLTIDYNNPGLYIDAQDRVNIGANYPPTNIEISIMAYGYDNISGFQFDMNYAGPITVALPMIPGGIFGTAENSTYFCMEPQDTGSSITQLACVALPGTPYYPNTDGQAHLYNISFIPTGAGTATFYIDTSDTINGPTIVADDNGSRISLLANTATKSVTICEDADGDGEFSTAECEDGINYDCRDDLDYVNTGHVEWCNGFDNDCDGTITDSVLCSAQTPQITSISGNGNPMYDGTPSDPNPTLSGNIIFSVDVTDSSLSYDGNTLGSNIDKAEFYVDNILVGTDDINGKTNYQITYDSTSLSDGQHELKVSVIDSLNTLISPVEITRNFTTNNNAICDIQSITWSQSSVTDGSSIDVTITGSPDCLGKSYTYASGEISYLECDGTTCEPIPSNIASSLPAYVLSFSGSTTITDSGFANWFLDNGGTDTDPEIKIVINDGTPIDKESGILKIINTPPTINDFGSTPGLNTATAYLTVSEESRFMIEYGTQSGVYTGQQISAGTSTSHEFTLSNLAPQTTYYYVITATDLGGLTVNTGEQTFQTTTYSTDFDNDGDVDLLDLWELATYFRITSSDPEWSDVRNNGRIVGQDYDINNDGKINILDLALLVRSFTG